jgi:hypothetical protein
MKFSSRLVAAFVIKLQPNADHLLKQAVGYTRRPPHIIASTTKSDYIADKTSRPSLTHDARKKVLKLFII